MKLFLALFLATPLAFAQIAATAPTINATLDHTKCSLAQTPQLDGRGPGFCIASDGLWRQLSTDVVPVRVDVVSNVTPATINGTPVSGQLTTADLQLDYTKLLNRPSFVTTLNGKSGPLTITAAPSTPSIPVPATTLTAPSVSVTVQ